MDPAPPSPSDDGADRRRAAVTVSVDDRGPAADDPETGTDPAAGGVADGSVVLPPGLARRLDADPGGTVLLTTTAGTRAAATASAAETPAPGTVGVPPGFADSIGVADGDRVVLEATTPVTAAAVTVAPVPALSLRGGNDTVEEALAGQPVVVGETVSVSLLGRTLDVPVRVVETDPSGVVTVGEETTVTVEGGPAGAVDGAVVVPSTAVGGYESTIAACQSALVGPLADADAYDAGGRSAATGVLVAGQAGVGKSHHIRHSAWLADAELVPVDATRLASEGYGAGTDYLDDARIRAIQHPRALVHVEGLDAFAGGSGSGADPAVERFGDWVGRLQRRPGVVVAGETRDAAELDDTLTRGDRFGRRIEVPRPTPEDRTAVFATLTRGLDLGPGVDPSTVGERALGYVSADLIALRARAVETAIERVRTDDRATDAPTVTAADVETALVDTTPAASSAAVVDVPDVSFDEVGGLPEAKRELTRAVEWPLRHPEALDRLGIDPPAGVLLYGPPGTGKTLLARAVASSTDANFLAVDGPELFDKFVGESERAVREVFRQARESAPAVIFFDEVDAIGSTRGGESGAAPERVVSQLLTELDGLEGREGITVLGATNRPDRIDPALLRPGRFDRTVEVGLPDRPAREEILRIHARDQPLEGVDLAALARRTDGYSGSDLAALLREASLVALEEQLDESDSRSPAEVSELVVRDHHVREALTRVSASSRSVGARSEGGSGSQKG